MLYQGLDAYAAGFPTLILFRDSAILAKYDGPRTVPDMIEFVQRIVSPPPRFSVAEVNFQLRQLYKRSMPIWGYLRVYSLPVRERIIPVLNALHATKLAALWSVFCVCLPWSSAASGWCERSSAYSS